MRKKLRGTNTLIVFFFKAHRSGTSVARVGGRRALQVRKREIPHLAAINRFLLLPQQSATAIGNAGQNVWETTASSVPGVPDPVPYHPLLTGTSLHHQAETKVGIFGHLDLQAPTRVSVDDRAVLQHTPKKIETILKPVTFPESLLFNDFSCLFLLFVPV